MVSTTLVKRRALFKDEVGLFPGNEMAAEDIAPFTLDREVMVEITSERKLEALRFLWGVVYKAHQNTDHWVDKDEAMEWYKTRAGYTRKVVDINTGQMVQRPKSLKRISEDKLRVLTERVLDITCAEILPGMKHNDLRREVEEMCKVKGV